MYAVYSLVDGMLFQSRVSFQSLEVFQQIIVNLYIIKVF